MSSDVRRPLEVVVLGLAGLGVAIAAMTMSWASGCFSRDDVRCGDRSAFQVLGWRTAIPILATGITLAAASRWATAPRSGRSASRALSAMALAGLVTLGFCAYGWSHPWSSDFPGQEPAGWTFGPGPAVLAASSLPLFVAFGLSVRRAIAMSPEAIPRWWRWLAGRRATTWFG